MTEQDSRLRELKDLVLEAFSIAAVKHKPEWYRMRGTVLKNRLLDLTDRSFKETQFGVDRFSDLVGLLGELLEVDHTIKPFVVELREPFRSDIAPPVHPEALTGEEDIRADLWNAIVNYRKAARWRWDPHSARALPLDEADHEDAEYLLPTLDRATLDRWRARFLQEQAPNVSDSQVSQLEDWASKGLGTWALPGRLIPTWNARQREGVYGRLLEFFRSHDMDPPVDMIVERKTRGPVRGPVDELRSFVMRCVSLMDERELKQLLIPAGTAMRARRR